MPRRLTALLLMLFAVGCASAAPPTPTVVPLDAVSKAVENIRAANTFRLSIESSGAPYFFQTDIGRVLFRRATAQYVSPNVLEATLRLIVAGLPTDIVIFARGSEQWYQHGIVTAGKWSNTPFSPGFNAGFLIDGDSGFQAAVTALRDLIYIGDETLESGATTSHYKSSADGPQISGLLADLIPLTGKVNVDLFIDLNLIMPIRFIVVEPESVSETETTPMTFIIDIFDINGAPALNAPDAGT